MSVAGGTHFLVHKTQSQAVEINPDAPIVELRNNLISLNRAYDEELRSLERYYSTRRKQLQVSSNAYSHSQLLTFSICLYLSVAYVVSLSKRVCICSFGQD